MNMEAPQHMKSYVRLLLIKFSDKPSQSPALALVSVSFLSLHHRGQAPAEMSQKREASERSSPRGEWGKITQGNEVFRVPCALEWMNQKAEIYFCDGLLSEGTAKRWGQNIHFEKSYPFRRDGWVRKRVRKPDIILFSDVQMSNIPRRVCQFYV